MATKITVNGKTYDSVAALPPDVRRIYERTLADLPDLVDRDGDGIPDGVQRDALGQRTVVRKKFIVNGTTYDDVSQLPPEVRQLYEQAMRKASEPAARQEQTVISIQTTAPSLRLHASTDVLGSSTLSRPGGHATAPLTGTPIPTPIELTSGSGVRFALIVGACAALGALVWFLTRAR